MKKASLTVEAALVLPIFIYGMLAILSMIQLIYIKEHIQNGITQAGRELSKYAFASIYKEKQSEAEGTDAVTDTISAQMLVWKNLNSAIVNDRWITGGMAGVLCRTSDDSDEYENEYKDEHGAEYEDAHKKNRSDNRIHLTVSYYFKPLCPVLNTVGIKMTQQIITREYVGAIKIKEEGDASERAEDEKEEPEEMVYVAQNGTVYHVSEECTHLKLTIETVSYSQMEEERNESGSRYKPCEKCCEGEADAEDTYYITKEGDHYHCHRDCPGLKRTVYEVPLGEAGDKEKCSKCG